MPHLLPIPSSTIHEGGQGTGSPRTLKIEGERQRLGLHCANLISSNLPTAGPLRKRLLFKFHIWQEVLLLLLPPLTPQWSLRVKSSNFSPGSHI